MCAKKHVGIVLDQRIYLFVTAVPFLGGIVLCAVAIFFVPLFQMFAWIRTGQWSAFPVRRVLDGLGLTIGPSTGWKGTDELLNWWMSSSANVALLVVGLLIAGASMIVMIAITKYQDERRRSWKFFE
jgi:hypothetical protein